jgi:hypothetical protein
MCNYAADTADCGVLFKKCRMLKSADICIVENYVRNLKGNLSRCTPLQQLENATEWSTDEHMKLFKLVSVNVYSTENS